MFNKSDIVYYKNNFEKILFVEKYMRKTWK